jgi:hypothetical protein
MKRGLAALVIVSLSFAASAPTARRSAAKSS